MNVFRKYQFWISLLAGIILFVLIYPFNHDMYIAEVFTLICIFLNGASSMLFAVILYQVLTKCFCLKDSGMYIGELVLLGILHGVFAFMNWGSWFCLGITAGVLGYIACLYFQEKRREVSKSEIKR